MSILKKINKHYYIIFLLLIFAVLNKFPQDYFFSGGDNWQIIFFENHFSKWKNTWSSENIGYPNTLFGHNIFYYPFYLIEKFVDIRPDFFALFFHFFFNLGTFYSFYFFLNTVKNNLNSSQKILLSFTYTANIFSFYLFWYSFSYTPFAFNYIFFPLIFSIFWVLLNYNFTDKFRLILLLPIFTFITSLSYSNIAFYFSTLILLSYILVIQILLERKLVLKKIINFLIFLIIFTVFSSYSIFPGLISSISLFFNPETSTIFYDNNHWVINNATAFPDPLFINDSIDIMKTAYPWVYFSIFNLMLIFLAIYFCKKFELNQVIILTLVLILIFIMNKGTGLFNTKMINEIFSSNLLTVFRSSDKASSYLQFFVIFSFVLFVDKVSENKKNKLIISFFIISLISSYPMIIGGVKKYHDVNYISKKQNYKFSRFSNIKKYPEDYIDMKNFFLTLNTNQNDKILILPYSVTSSQGWTDIISLRHRGANPVQMLFKNPVLEINTPVYKSWLWGEYLQQGDFQPWKFNSIKLLQIKYVLLHKDVSKFRVSQGLNFMGQLIDQNLVKIKKETKNLILYEITNQNFTDKILFLPKFEFKNVDNYIDYINVLNSFDINKKINSIINFTEKENYKINNSTAIIASTFNITDEYYSSNKQLIYKKINKKFELKYKKINDAKYIVDIKNYNNKNAKVKITLNTTFSKFWIANCINCKINYEFQNNQYNYYSNVFESIIDPNDKNLKIEIYFMPEKYIKGILHFILFAILLSFLTYLKLKYYKKK